MTAISSPMIAVRAPRSFDTTTRTAEVWMHNVAERRTATGRRHSRGVYWRRRLVALTVMAGVVALVRPAAGALTNNVSGPAVSPHAVEVRTYVVQPGDSLWTAASHLAPGTDPRKVVEALEEARHGRTLMPGEMLTWVP